MGKKIQIFAGFGNWFNGVVNLLLNWKVAMSTVAAIIAGILAFLQSVPPVFIGIAVLLTFTGIIWAWNGIIWLRDRQYKLSTEKKIQGAAPLKDPEDTFIILHAGIETVSLSKENPAWELFFTAYNGGLWDVKVISAFGSFKINGQAYPGQTDLKKEGAAKYGEISLFTVRQWINKSDVPQKESGQNHVVLQLDELKIKAVATDPTTGKEQKFVIPLPNHLQLDVRDGWNITPDFFSRFYRDRLGSD